MKLRLQVEIELYTHEITETAFVRPEEADLGQDDETGLQLGTRRKVPIDGEEHAGESSIRIFRCVARGAE